jgi:hypothetical protein
VKILTHISAIHDSNNETISSDVTRSEMKFNKLIFYSLATVERLVVICVNFSLFIFSYFCYVFCIYC